MKLNLKILGVRFSCTRICAVFDVTKVLKNVRPFFCVIARALPKGGGQKTRHAISAIAAHATKDKYFCI